MKIFKSKKLIQKIIISMFLLILVFNLVMPSVVYGDDNSNNGHGEPITKEEYKKKYPDSIHLNDTNVSQWFDDGYVKIYDEGGSRYQGLEGSRKDTENWDSATNEYESVDEASDIAGGVLFNPLIDILCSVGDSAINLVRSALDGKLGAKKIFLNSTEDGEKDIPFMIDADKYKDVVGSSGDDSSDGTLGNTTVDVAKFDKGWLNTKKMYQIPTVTYSPEEIFAGKVPALSINFISVESNASKTTKTVHNVIARWYVSLRNIAIIGLQVILVYVGIRMVTSSIAAEKAKYKQLFTDWLIALCLIFVLHYLMLFVINLTNTICNALGENASQSILIKVKNAEGNEPDSFKTNLLGEVRFLTQYKRLLVKVTYAILYAFLVYYTIYFTFVYLKRVLLMAFLTLIAPLVALTYPIDKMNDGSAQAFNAWLKEYVYNALIQPFHLILYVVLVSSAANLVQSNFLYAIAAIWFITKAEGLLRQIFGFNKAPSLGNTMGGFAGGMLASNLLKSVKGGSGSKKSSGSGGKSSDSEENEKTPRFVKNPGVEGIAEASGIEAESNEDEQRQARMDELGNQMDAWDEEHPNHIMTAGDERWRMQEEYENLATANQDNGNNEQTDNANNTDNTGRNRYIPKINNWVNAHGGKGKLAKKAIKGVVRNGMKYTAAGAGILAGTIAGAATGKGVTGMIAGAAAGGKLGSMAGAKTANMAINAAGAISRAPESFDAALGKQLDLANGNTYYQDAAEIRKFKENEDNIQYVTDMMTAENNGKAPTRKEVKERMEQYTPFLEKGMRDIKSISKADKVANTYGLKREEVAQIAVVGQNRGITKDVLNDDKKSKAALSNLNQEFLDKKYSANQAKMLSDRSINVLKAMNGVSHNLQRRQ